MSDEVVVRQCAPTLACMKTGSLFTAAFPSKDAMHQAVRLLNLLLHARGIRVRPLRWQGGRELIYLYRPDRLMKDLRDETAQKLLGECGYPVGDALGCLCMLRRRLREERGFPHEIGLFLGYPPRDVDGFMHRRDECKLCGMWKCYDDTHAAQATWAKCQMCTRNYIRRLQSGWTLDALAVGHMKEESNTVSRVG